MAPVTKVSWCPGNDWHVASCQSSTGNSDHNIHIWDIRRPYLPYSSFNAHSDPVTGNLYGFTLIYIIVKPKTFLFRVIPKIRVAFYRAAKMAD